MRLTGRYTAELQRYRRSARSTAGAVPALSGTGGASTMSGACRGQIRGAGRSYLTLAAVPLRRETLVDVCGRGGWQGSAPRAAEWTRRDQTAHPQARLRLFRDRAPSHWQS